MTFASNTMVEEGGGTDPETLLHDALNAPEDLSGKDTGGVAPETSSRHSFHAGRAQRPGHLAHRGLRLPGWQALKAEMAENGRQTHFAPAMPSVASMPALPLSFTGQPAQSVAGDANLAAQVLDGLEPALAQAAPQPAQRPQATALTVHTLEIRLHPEHLGAIAAHVERRGDVLEVTLRAARRDVAEELEKTAHHLADRLQAAAGHATRVQLHVAVLPPAAGAESQQPNAQAQQQGAGAFARDSAAGQNGQAAQQQPGGQHHARRHGNIGGSAENGGPADGGAAHGGGVRGLYL
jgi:hypothetical protein